MECRLLCAMCTVYVWPENFFLYKLKAFCNVRKSQRNTTHSSIYLITFFFRSVNMQESTTNTKITASTPFVNRKLHWQNASSNFQSNFLNEIKLWWIEEFALPNWSDFMHLDKKNYCCCWKCLSRKFQSFHSNYSKYCH